MSNTVNTLNRLKHELNRFIEEYEAKGIEVAKAEHEYRLAKAKKILELRADGTSISILQDLAKGDEIVCQKPLEWNIALALYKSLHERIMATKKDIDVTNDMIQREWGAMKYAP